MTEYALSTHQLTRRFSDITAVDQVSLQVPKGCVFGFLGPNGAGKSTTIRMLLGLLRPNSGDITLLGTPFGRHRKQLARVGSLVEAPSLYPHLSAYENLQVMCRLSHTVCSQIKPSLELVGLDPNDKRATKTYSLGMRQRLGLALALLREPELLILDEPTNGLDPAGIHEIRELLCRLPQETGVTVFLSSHLLSEVEQMATHLGIIRRGQLVFQGTIQTLYGQTTEHVVLSVTKPKRATAVLQASGWQVRHRDDGSLCLPVAGSSDAARINAQLVEAGLGISSIAVQRPTLEDLFLQLTLPETNDAIACKTDRKKTLTAAQQRA